MRKTLAIAAIVALSTGIASPQAAISEQIYCGDGWYANQIQIPNEGSLIEARVHGRDIGSAVNVRSHPERQNEVVATVGVGDKILISERVYVEFYDEYVGQSCDLWYQVHHFGTQEPLGWVYGEFIAADVQWVSQE